MGALSAPRSPRCKAASTRRFFSAGRRSLAPCPKSIRDARDIVLASAHAKIRGMSDVLTSPNAPLIVNTARPCMTYIPIYHPPAAPNRRVSVALGAQRVQGIFEVVEGLPRYAGWRSRAAYISYVNLRAPALGLTEPEFAELRRRYSFRCDSAGIQILEHDRRVYVWHGPAPSAARMH